MEVLELKEWMDTRIADLEKIIVLRYDSSEKRIEALEGQVRDHSGWINSIKGVWIAIVTIAGLIGFIIKTEFWKH